MNLDIDNCEGQTGYQQVRLSNLFGKKVRAMCMASKSEDVDRTIGYAPC